MAKPSAHRNKVTCALHTLSQDELGPKRIKAQQHLELADTSQRDTGMVGVPLGAFQENTEGITTEKHTLVPAQIHCWPCHPPRCL